VRVNGILQVGVADVELRLAAGVAAIIGCCTVGRVATVESELAAGRSSSSLFG
jgi:hypothetical protein